MKITLITAAQIVQINQMVCAREQQTHLCYSTGKIESALNSAFYPGSHPFHHGGIAKIAGALCFYLTKAHAFFDGNKRTSAIATTVLLDLNHYALRYPLDPLKDINAFAQVIDDCAASIIPKEELINWFDQHKTPTQERIKTRSDTDFVLESPHAKSTNYINASCRKCICNRRNNSTPN
jgi:prophage maintenance system killer protein